MKTFGRWQLLLLAGLMTAACTAAPPPRGDSWQSLRQPDGSVLWLDEYRFVPPPQSWQLLNLEDRDSSLVLYKACDEPPPGGSPCETTIAYAEEPFGYSRELEPRAREFLKRFLWASRVSFSPPELTPATLNDREILVVQVTGEEPVLHHRVSSRIVFMHRGERVVAFFTSQWRGGDASFSAEEFAEFDRFVASFRFVTPSFYEKL